MWVNASRRLDVHEWQDRLHSVGPTPEICDGKDNDCNGSVDDGLVPPGDSCNPEGMAPGQTHVRVNVVLVPSYAGAAKAGNARVGWGRLPRSATARTTIAMGCLDNNASCAAGYVCVSGQCVPTCTTRVANSIHAQPIASARMGLASSRLAR
jgi:hypothetical protein